jgi:hypothetical protein
MTNRSKRFLSDIPIETKNNSVMGIIDSVQIRSLDAKVRNFCKNKDFVNLTETLIFEIYKEDRQSELNL